MSLTHLCLSSCLCEDTGHLFSHVKDSSNNIHPIEQPREWRKALTYAQKLVWVSLKTLRVKRGLKDMGERVFVCFLLCLNLGVSARFRLTQHLYNVTSALRVKVCCHGQQITWWVNVYLLKRLLKSVI